MVQAFPNDRLKQHHEVGLPLHNLMMYYGAKPVSPRRLRLLLDGCRETLMLVRNAEGKLPLQVYTSERCEAWRWERWNENEQRQAWEAFEAILRVIVPLQDGKDWLPLDAIASNLVFIPTELLRIAITFNKADAYKHNNAGLIPLHVAVLARPPTVAAEDDTMYDDSVIELLNAAPETLSAVHPATGFLPFQLAAAKDNSLNTVYSFLRRNPSLLYL